MRFAYQLILLVLASSIGAEAQTLVMGRVTDPAGNSLAGANVYVKGSYDGCSTDADGAFQFNTLEVGNQILVAAFLGYTEHLQAVNIAGKTLEVNLTLRVAPQKIDDVVIVAGTYETADRKRSVTLQPLDIVTTPSALGEIYGAISTLPGTATIGEDGRLFVRGGDGYETKTFVDGLLSKKPYSSSLPDLPSRGRFSPFLFSGTTFSTGGYSAEYGQALSSALILNSNSFPQKTQTELSLMSIGGSLTQTIKGKNTSASVGLEYTNLTPYFKLVETKHTMTRYPESVGGTLFLHRKVSKNGVLKVFSTLSGSQMGILYPNMQTQGEMSALQIRNSNSFTNVTYSDNLGDGWILKGGIALTADNNNTNLEVFEVTDVNTNLQAKISVKKSLQKNMSLLGGFEHTLNRYKQNFTPAGSETSYISKFEDNTSALFTEIEFKPLPQLAVRAGVRGEHSSLLSDQNLAARLSAAIKFTTASQVSIAYGNFFQTPEEEHLRFTKELGFEQANHYIINYQWEKNNRIVRVEGYHKEYFNLVTYNPINPWNGSDYTNGGNGYSRGVDVFFRDRQTLKNFDYWISYSFVDSKRKYRDYPSVATPTFAPTHSLSIVAKKWIQSITTQFGLSTSLASGRSYNNPNSQEFMGERTPFYHDLSVNCSHLTTILGMGTIVYLSVNNVFGRDNIFGYRYYSTPNEAGVYEGIPVMSNTKRFFFIGLFLTI